LDQFGSECIQNRFPQLTGGLGEKHEVIAREDGGQ
jgi:hypothetical protein